MDVQTSLQRHPKCSALYATRMHRNSETATSLAPSFANLANVTVEVTTKTLTRDAATFALTLHDRKSSATWRHLRSYADCRDFQTRVLALLSRGHLCFAECPWLFTYVQRALPAERTSHQFFRVPGHSAKVQIVENQRKKLAQLFATLQRVLLNPLNHKCSVLMQKVAPEVMKFITNRSEEQQTLNSPSSDRPLAKTFSEAFMFELETNSDQEFGHNSTTTISSTEDVEVAQNVAQNVETIVAGQRVCCAMCALHQKTSDEQVFTYWRAKSISSRFMRLRAERISISAKRKSVAQLPHHTKSVWQSPTYSQRVTSLLEVHDDTQMIATKHDGTPTDPFPTSPGTPRVSIVSSSRTSSVCEIDLELLDSWRLSSANPVQKEKHHTVKTLGVENLRRMPRRSFLIFHSIRNKFATSKNSAGIAI